ncbi:MAG: DUF3108 domain-containing protein [Desulfobulbaceae bacterium]
MVDFIKFIFFATLILLASAPRAEELAEGVMRPELLPRVFSGDETMHFAVSWTGGIRIGDLDLEQRPDTVGGFAIHARVSNFGALRMFYPVDDTFVTYVRGDRMLPYRYEVVQREGWRGRETRRLTRYDQHGLTVNYRKNEEAEQVISIAGPVYNEFSSFYITRVMDLVPGGAFMVPTFADRKRNEVKVLVRGREVLDTPYGRVATVQVMPIMKFKGLYDKAGDTVIWLTDDACRVPIKINSKIAIGSLTATLDGYHNPACENYRLQRPPPLQPVQPQPVGPQ